MVPRVDVVWINIHQTNDEILSEVLNSPYPRMPVCEDEIDNIKGVVNVKEVLAYYIQHQTLHLEKLLFDPCIFRNRLPPLKYWRCSGKQRNTLVLLSTNTDPWKALLLYMT